MQSGFELMVAPTGARLQKSDHPQVPLGTDEIVATAIACAQEGATAIHAHVRNPDGTHSIDAGQYNHLASNIAEHTQLGIQVSTEAAGVFEVSDQMRCLENVSVKDVSASIREIARAPDLTPRFYDLAVRRGISIQHILYDADDLGLLRKSIDSGHIPASLDRAIFVLGRYAKDMQSKPSDLDPFLDASRGMNLNWSVCAFGQQEHLCLLAALDHGGNVRIGFENSRSAPDGTIHPDNAASVALFVEAAQKRGFSPRRLTP